METSQIQHNIQNQEPKFAGSVTFGKAPHPKDLPIPIFIKKLCLIKGNIIKTPIFIQKKK